MIVQRSGLIRVFNTVVEVSTMTLALFISQYFGSVKQNLFDGLVCGKKSEASKTGNGKIHRELKLTYSEETTWQCM